MQDIEPVVYQAQQGQLDAFATLYDRFQNRVYNIAYAVLRNEAEAEDAVQDTFLAVFQKIGGYQGRSAFETWLLAIAVNQSRMRLRKQRVRNFFSLEQLSGQRRSRPSGAGEDVADIVHERQRRQTLWDLVDRLDERLRLPLILRYRYGVSCPDIAVILSLRKSTVYQQLYEGRKHLEKMAQQQAAGRPAPSVEPAN